jgi:hypothetical protein
MESHRQDQIGQAHLGEASNMSKSGKNGRRPVPGNNGKSREEAQARSLANLEPHKFKPGQSGNPLGASGTQTVHDGTREVLGAPHSKGQAASHIPSEARGKDGESRAKKSDTLMKEIVERLDGAVSKEESPANIGVRVIVMDGVPRPDRSKFYAAQRAAKANGNDEEE